MDKFKEFYLLRKVDVSGTSGTGIVARGVVFPSGKAIMEWTSFHTSMGIYNNVDDVLAIHGHNGATEVVMGAPPEPKKRKKVK